MSDTTAGVLTIVSPAVALALVHRPFGDYLYRSLDATTHTRAERLAYRLVGVASAASWSVRRYQARRPARPIRPRDLVMRLSPPHPTVATSGSSASRGSTWSSSTGHSTRGSRPAPDR